MLLCWHQAIATLLFVVGPYSCGLPYPPEMWNGPFKWFDPVRSMGYKWSHSSILTIEWAQTREYAASQNRLCGQPNSDKTKHLLFDLSILRLGGKEFVTEMMTTLSQTVSVFSNKAINLKSVASFNTIKTLRFNPPSSPRSLSRLVFKRLSLIIFFWT